MGAHLLQCLGDEEEGLVQLKLNLIWIRPELNGAETADERPENPLAFHDAHLDHRANLKGGARPSLDHHPHARADDHDESYGVPLGELAKLCWGQGR